MVYSTVIFSLSGMRKLGLENSKCSVHLRRRKVQRKEDDGVDLVSELIMDNAVRVDLLC